MKGRGILDNVSLAQELTQDIDRHCSGRNVIFKLDMVKAYDRLEWDFLFAVLSRFGFHPRWKHYVRAMFTDCWKTILLHGAVHGFSKSSRGLRQALAPSLFILAEEVLSRGLSKLYAEGSVAVVQPSLMPGRVCILI